MMYCTNCGAKLNPKAEFCGQCGMQIENNEIELIKRDGKDTNQTKTSLDGNEPKMKLTEIVTEDKVKKTEKLKCIDLWTCLKVESKRQQYFTEELPEIEEEDFMELVSKKMQNNSVPAKLEKCEVFWDSNELRKKDYYTIAIDTKFVNPFTYLIQYNTIGKFSFVEEKAFITPPKLPSHFLKPKEIKADLIKMKPLLIYGILGAIFGILLWPLDLPAVSLFIISISILAAILSVKARNEIKEIENHNDDYLREQKRLDQAWEYWEETIFSHSFQEDINGHLSRIYDSVFECIKQVSLEVFDQKPSIEEMDKANMNELEQLISRRKEDYK